MEKKHARLPILPKPIGALVLLLLLGGPVAIAFGFPPAGWRLARPWVYGGDFSQYLSAMDQGMAGAWRIVNRFSPEPHPPALQYLFYVALGHLARILGAPLESLYAVVAVAGLLILWDRLLSFFGAFLPDREHHPIALGLALSTGPVWMIPLGLSLFRIASPWGQAAMDVATRIEHNTFLALMAPPHLTLALALLLTALSDLSAPPSSASMGSRLRLSATPLLLAALNPFSLISFLAFLCVWLSVHRQEMIPGLRHIAPPVLLTVPLVGYHVAIFQRDPFWSVAYGQQNLQPPYPPPLVLAAFGLMGLLALPGVLRGWGASAGPDVTRWRFLAGSAGALFLLSYLPLPYARRFAYGIGPLLSALAAPVAADLYARFRSWWTTPGRRVLGGAAIGIALYSQNAFLYTVYTLSMLGTGPFPRAVFEPVAAFEAAMWLRQQGAQVVVLACEADGNFLAGYIRGRVVLGHPGATFQVARKREEVAAFFRGDLPPEEARALLQRYRVTHLYARDDQPCHPRQSLGELAFERPPVRIFRIWIRP